MSIDDKSKMNKLIGKLEEKIEWYISAHGHSLSGGLHYIRNRVPEKNLSEIQTGCEGLDRILREFTATSDLKEQFAALNSTYESIKKGIEDLEKTDFTEGAYKNIIKYLENIGEHIKTMGEIIENPLLETEYPIQNVIRQVMKQIERAYPGKDIADADKIHQGKIRIDFEGPVEDLRHKCCGYEIKLMIYNLMANAVEAMERGTINIGLENKPEEGFAIISIQNSGSFIIQENIDKIMQRKRFSTKSPDGGQGLKIVYDVLEKYDATLRVTSSVEQNWTRFEIDLPYTR